MGRTENTITEPVSTRSAPPQGTDPDDAAALVEEDSLVEEVSIDGMCGVY